MPTGSSPQKPASGNGILMKVRQGWALAIAIAITLVRVRSYRLRLMLGCTIAALLMLGIGANPLAPWLMGSPWRFLLYWGACFALCLFMLALAWIELASLKQARILGEAMLMADLQKKAHEDAVQSDQGRESQNDTKPD